MKKEQIDVVVTWVDGKDILWRLQKNQYEKESLDGDNRELRYRDWDNLKYLFRSIEKNMPWVNHVYLVTCGQCPEWFDTECKRATLICHEAFIPHEFLPTFAPGPIELNLHRIPGLSEKFVYFNDDMFVINMTKENDFFKNGYPCDSVGFAAIPATLSSDGKGIYGMEVMDTYLVAKNYKKKDILKNNWKKFFDIRNGRDLLKTITVLPYRDITGFNFVHTAHSYLKQSFIECWEKEEQLLIDTCRHRIRPNFWISQWGIREWQICAGNFEIRPRSFSSFYDVCNLKDMNKVVKEITKPKHKLLCINDNIEKNEYFEKIREGINTALEKRFPVKSMFER